MIYEPKRRPRRYRVVLRDVEHHLSDWGEDNDPLLVWLHGWGDAGSTAQFVVDALSRKCRVVAPDFRGFGRSEHCGPAYWFPDYLADLDALLAALCPLEPVTLAGHSMGGNVAALYAGIMPERVAALINLEGFGLPDSDPHTAPAHYRRWLEGLRREQPFSSWDDFEALAARVLKRSPRMGLERARYVARQWGRENAAGRIELRADPAHRLPNAVLYRRREAEACWAGIRAPTLFLYGTDSEFRQRISAAEADCAAGGPGAAQVGIEESGHMLHFEAPERVASAIEAFLAGL